VNDLCGLQNDFGGFDSKFSGICLKFQESKAFDLFLLMNNANRDSDKVVRIGNDALANLENDKVFATFAIATTQPHELKHFHDSLLSPYGNHIFRLRVNAAINGMQLASRIIRNRKIIFVPFSKWKSLPKKDIEETLKRCVLYSQYKNMVEFPSLEEEWEVMRIETEKMYKIIQNLLLNNENSRLGIPIQPSHIFEASAILVQIQNVHYVFGVEHANLFIREILSNPSLKQYALVLKLLDILFSEKGWPNDFNAWATIIHWCLFGDFEKDGWNACPAARFIKLFVYLSEVGSLPIKENIWENLTRWDEIFSFVPVEESLRRVCITNKRVLEATKIKFRDKKFDKLLALFESRVKAQSYLTEKVLDNIQQYVRPYSYQENSHKWIAAPVKVQFQGIGLPANSQEVNDILTAYRYKDSGNGEQLVISGIFKGQTMGIEFINPVISADVDDTFVISDYFFRNAFRNEQDFDIMRQMCRDKGVLPVEILP
jgi:hypothetical protein